MVQSQNSFGSLGPLTIFFWNLGGGSQILEANYLYRQWIWLLLGLIWVMKNCGKNIGIHHPPGNQHIKHILFPKSALLSQWFSFFPPGGISGTRSEGTSPMFFSRFGCFAQSLASLILEAFSFTKWPKKDINQKASATTCDEFQVVSTFHLIGNQWNACFPIEVRKTRVGAPLFFF